MKRTGGCLVGGCCVNEWGIKCTRTSDAGPSLITVHPEN